MRLRPEALSWREVDDEAVVLDLKSSTYFRANRTGVFLLRALMQECQRETLISEMSGEYGITADQAGRDVDSFLGELARRGLLVDGPS